MGNNNPVYLRRSRQYLTEDIFDRLNTIKVDPEMSKRDT
jgi:hypothetical protein